MCPLIFHLWYSERGFSICCLNLMSMQAVHHFACSCLERTSNLNTAILGGTVARRLLFAGGTQWPSCSITPALFSALRTPASLGSLHNQ
jgi:hypothetical protein